MFPRDPHSVVAKNLGVVLTGRSARRTRVSLDLRAACVAFASHEPDEYAPFNTGFIVYHDDLGDYSTNEPIMDGTANLTYLVGALARNGARSAR